MHDTTTSDPVSADEKALAAQITCEIPAHPEFVWSGLYRALVELPQHLCQRDRPLQTRLAFFQAEHGDECRTLERLLALAWNTDTDGCVANGYGYNIVSASEWFASWAEGEGDVRLFESHWGPEGIGYHQREDIDFLVNPRLKARLEAALRSVEALQAARQRAGAATVKVALQRVSPARLA